MPHPMNPNQSATNADAASRLTQMNAMLKRKMQIQVMLNDRLTAGIVHTVTGGRP